MDASWLQGLRRPWRSAMATRSLEHATSSAVEIKGVLPPSTSYRSITRQYWPEERLVAGSMTAMPLSLAV
ncbi:hypothetical protein, partial [Delftia acidovorans]|uniref:hypothetical protein n=1 Tax=Delftia acidovorans TaxID=80866 RepID=UPI00359FEF1E